MWVLWVIMALLLLILLVYWLISPAKLPLGENGGAVQAFNHRNVAHRGLHTQDKTVPENSLAAFAAACEKGYGIELDIQLTADGQVVVFHDDTLKRVCGVDARVDEKTWQQLQALRLHETQERIPLFSEVLALVAGRVPLVVELKMGKRNAELCGKAWQLLSRYKGIYCIESFDPRIVYWWRKNHPIVLRGQLSAPASSLQSGISGFAVANLLTNCLARPHFIAYEYKPAPLLARLARKRAMCVTWTIRPDSDIAGAQAANNVVIFEYYLPEVIY